MINAWRATKFFLYLYENLCNMKEMYNNGTMYDLESGWFYKRAIYVLEYIVHSCYHNKFV